MHVLGPWYSGTGVYVSWVPGIVELVCTCHVLGPWYSGAGVYVSWVPGIVELVCTRHGS